MTRPPARPFLYPSELWPQDTSKQSKHINLDGEATVYRLFMLNNDYISQVTQKKIDQQVDQKQEMNFVPGCISILGCIEDLNTNLTLA